MSLWKRLFSRDKPLNRSGATGRVERPLVPEPIQRSGNPAAVVASSTPLPRVVPPSAPIGTFPKDLFISYAHKDNARGQVRELRDAIVSDFRAFAGRDLNVFFDEEDIPTMAAWEQRIYQGLRESRLFLAVFSPNYFASQFCRREWEEFVRYEAIRQCLGEGVAPVYFVELPGTRDGNIGPVLPDWAKGHRLPPTSTTSRGCCRLPTAWPRQSP